MDDSSLEAECDEEIARYSSQARSKEILNGDDQSVSRRHNNNNNNSHHHHHNQQQHEEDPPRPMSWDGGLSDTENSVVSFFLSLSSLTFQS